MTNPTQIGNTVGGDQAGRDINKTIHVPLAPTTISRLHERLKANMASDDATRRAVERLRHYQESMDTAEPIGLERKLQAASREAWLAEAIRKKELINMRFLENNLSENGEAVFLYVLTKTLTLFDAKVAPLVRAGRSEIEIRTAMSDQVTDVVLADLQDNPLGLMPDELDGLIWYLTGNCYINWVQNAELSPST